MIQYKKGYQITPEWKDREWIMEKADKALTAPIFHVTDFFSPHSHGGIHDFYSNSDYWWPNPDTPDGIPYIRRDGETNPDNFNEHRMAMRHMRSSVVSLASAYVLTKEEIYARKAVQYLKEFFLDEETYMAPHLSYAQAIIGTCPGRGIGIIDTLHLADVVFAAEHLKESQAMTENVYQGLKSWFARYLGWMLTDANGIQEMNQDNNHAVCYFVQAAAFALFTDNERIADFCREFYKKELLKQEAEDGSFPEELGRTKPYGYSIFVVDNLVNICQMLSKPEDDLWTYVNENGRSIEKALDYLTPYILKKESWPYAPDVMHYDAYPARAGFMKFAGYRLGRKELLDLYEQLPKDIPDEEARRNVSVRQPMLWM